MKETALKTILLLLIISSSLYSDLPVSSFIIEPLNLKSDIYSRNEVKYAISSSDEEFALPETSSQRIVSSSYKKGIKQYILLSGSHNIPDITDKSAYLKNTPYLNLENPGIKKTAGNFNKSRNPVNDISMFVYKYITGKKDGLNIIPASEILKNRSGDCKHHSILTVALLRANKIPARAVVGIILSEYYNSKKNVFVYHMWVEAYSNGRWFLVDSTRPADTHHGRYIAFAYHNLLTETPLDYLTAVSAINNVKISQAD